MNKPEIGLYSDATSDERIAYETGWNTARAIDRAEVFGAIRRAATIARECDRRHAIIAGELEHGSNYQALTIFELQAGSVRLAIRAAIGSGKA